MNTTNTSPYFGEVRKSCGYRYMWQACADCGMGRWVVTNKEGIPRHTRCYLCAMKKQRGKNNPNWQGGKIRQGGYVMILLEPTDFFYSMAGKNGYVMEHRLIMAKHLGRCLQEWEKVHHKDGIRDHNVVSNFKLTTNGSHALEHSKGYRDGYQQGYLDAQSAKIEELRKEIRLLGWQLKESVSRVL